MPVRCLCNTCDGKFVHSDTARNHMRAFLKNQTISQQNVQHRNLRVASMSIGESSTMVPTSTSPRNMQGAPLLPLIDCPRTSSAVLDLGDGTLQVSSIDLDVITPHASYDNRLHSDPLEPQFNPINNISKKQRYLPVPCGVLIGLAASRKPPASKICASPRKLGRFLMHDLQSALRSNLRNPHLSCDRACQIQA